MTKKEYIAAQEKAKMQIRRGYITIQDGAEIMLRNLRQLRDETDYFDESGNFIDLHSAYHRVFLDLVALTR